MSKDTQTPLASKIEPQPFDPAAVVVNQIILRPVDRTPKDIERWRNAHKSAENVYYPNRTRLYDLYDDILIDGHLTGVIGKRFDAVINKDLYFEKDGKKIDEIDTLIESEVFECLMEDLLWTKMWGISGFEFVPGAEFKYELVPRKHIKPEFGVIAKEQSEVTGIPYDGVDNLWIVGNKKDVGILLKCAPYVLWKRGNMADWAQYVEIFGQPVRVIKYDANDIKTKMELQEVVDEAGSSLALLIPKQADFEMMDGKQSNGDGKLQDTLKKACDDELSVIVLYNTETTTSSKGSGYAQSKEHGKQQLQVTKRDLKYLRNKLNSTQFIKILASYGYPVDGGRFTFSKELDLDDLSTKKDIDMAVSNKVPIGDDYWYETYGIPKPDNYDELKAKMEADKQAKLQAKNPQPGQNPPGKPEKNGNKGGTKKDAKDQKAETKLKFWQQLSARLADFFDPAHNG